MSCRSLYKLLYKALKIAVKRVLRNDLQDLH